MEIIIKIKENKTFWSLIMAGIMALVILYFIAPDKSDQIYKMILLFAFLCFTLGFLYLFLPKLLKEIRR